MKSKLNPEIRFPGFTAGWELCKLGEISDINTGPFGSTLHAEDYVEEGTPIITTEHFKQGHLPKTKCNTPQVSDTDYLRLKSYKLQEGDIVFSRVGSVDINALVTSLQDGWLFSGRVLRVRPQKQFFSDYLHYLLDTTSVRNDVVSRAVGQTMPSINTEILKETKIVTSKNIDEQKRIASVLRHIDDTLTLHQQELTTLKQTKQGFLQKMFPKEGESVPEVRFPGFIGDWGQRNLESIYGKIRNAFVGTATPYYVEDGHFYLESNNVKDGQINRNTEVFINDEFYEKQKDNWLHTGDLVMVQSGHVGHTAVIPEELDNTAAHALIMFSNYREKADPYFLNYQFQTYKSKKKLNSITTGNTIKHILASEMKKFLVDIPGYQEQQTIGNFFKLIDDTIALHQCELDTLKETKKAFLQKMFV
ncbi:restriction endonuclease subunit S [Bacillus haynesii]|uniref:restriction endonuclease subunit S n=1 Tax=Bacillus haynesii TaxID=1925021 RepID=UPI0003ED9E50|nr:restriction endonuclease subunit S [Bacillus haynesii]EWH23145.1 restriction endonuclease subunit S [Bacillus haynesii]